MREHIYQAGLIGGEWVSADSGAVIEVRNPATGAVLATVPDMGAAETRHAIEIAQAAMVGWAARTAGDRARILRRFYDLTMAEQEALASLLTREQGKPIKEARAEIAYAASFIEWFSEEARRAYGEVIPGHAADKRIVVLKQPIGVVAAITPWNFPSAMITRKIGPALAAGCTVVLKPATQTPLSALALAALALEAGVPPGVFNVVTGSAREIGGELTRHPAVRKISFTGSTEVGRTLMAQSAATIKKLSLELGGNAPFIVFDDADVDAAVEGALVSKFRNSGQTCVCTNRFFVQEGIHDAFVAKLAARVAQMQLGDGMDAATDLGPLIDDKACAKVAEHIADALAQGARLETGGKAARREGTYFEPTVLSEVTDTMLVAREETFGPLAPVMRFRTEAEVLERANASEFGLAGYVYTRDLARTWRVSEALETGMIGINTGLISTEVAPFGGIKQSGLGREGSRHGMDDYLELKYLCMGI